MTTATAVEGIVISNEAPGYQVEVDGREVRCVLRGRLKQAARAGGVRGGVAVGDRVDVRLQADGTGAIEAIRPRRSELVRPGFRGAPLVMAANVDRLVIVQSTVRPEFKRGMVERFQALARSGGMETVIVVNKCDLVPEETVREWVRPFAAAGETIVLTSVAEGRGIDELRALLVGKISVLAGRSGAGKSSLVNAMFPGTGARIGAVSEKLSKGRHTTTSSRLYPLPGGGYLADTPGIRTLGLFEEDEEAVAEVFPEIEEAAEGCRFRDCSHTHERDCGVRRAVEAGSILRERFESYRRMRSGG